MLDWDLPPEFPNLVSAKAALCHRCKNTPDWKFLLFHILKKFMDKIPKFLGKILLNSVACSQSLSDIPCLLEKGEEAVF